MGSPLSLGILSVYFFMFLHYILNTRSNSKKQTFASELASKNTVANRRKFVFP